MADSGHLRVLLHVCDSLFPLGAFAHSDGLEAAAASGLVSAGPSLRAWMEAARDEGLARAEGPALRITSEAFVRRDFLDVGRVDDELHALRPAMAARQASRAMGTRLLATWQQIRPHQDIGELMAFRTRQPGASEFTLPVAFGVVCAASGVPLRAALEAYFYTRLAATISAAMRLMPVGQHEAHAILAEMLDGVPNAVEDSMAGTEPESFVPAFDFAAMSHQYVHSRLFRS
jgi:urease accessory protein